MGESHVIAAGAALSAFSGQSQHNRLTRLEFPFEDGPPSILLPNKLVAHEEVSRGFRIQVEVLSDDPRIPLKLVMGKMATISLVRQDGSLRYFNGYITEFRFLRSDGGFAFYQMVLEPWLAFARLRKDCVSLHHKSVREITEETLKHNPHADWHMHVYEDDPRLTVKASWPSRSTPPVTTTRMSSPFATKAARSRTMAFANRGRAAASGRARPPWSAPTTRTRARSTPASCPWPRRSACPCLARPCAAPSAAPEPRPLIGDRDYLILSVDHEASNNYQAGPGAPSHYENRFTCVRKDIRLRPGLGFNSQP